MRKRITVLKGDGIGPEVIAEALKVLTCIEARYGHHFAYNFLPVGGEAIDATGDPLPKETLDSCLSTDATLLGAVGGLKWDQLPLTQRPEQGLFRLRQGMGLYANLRPAQGFGALASKSPLKEELFRQVDLVVVREFTGGLYFGRHEDTALSASDQLRYTVDEVERVLRVAFRQAQKRRKKLTSVDKENALSTGRLWRRVAERVSKEFKDVELTHLHVDAAAMQMVRDPSQFDVVVSSNAFGDILQDEASALLGSMGMMPSASFGDRFCLFEPAHGSAPKMAGQDKANPIGAILAAAMMLDAFGLRAESEQVRGAIAVVLEQGMRTYDIWEEGCTLCSCREMGSAVAEQVMHSD